MLGKLDLRVRLMINLLVIDLLLLCLPTCCVGMTSIVNTSSSPSNCSDQVGNNGTDQVEGEVVVVVVIFVIRSVVVASGTSVLMVTAVAGDHLGSGINVLARRHGRTLAMLVLMTIHDIMKLDILRPSVLGAEFCGYKPGDASQLQIWKQKLMGIFHLELLGFSLWQAISSFFVWWFQILFIFTPTWGSFPF